MMSNEDLGLNTFAKQDNDNQFITIVEDAAGKKRRLQLEPNPIAHQRAIVCCGIFAFVPELSTPKIFKI